MKALTPSFFSIIIGFRNREIGRVRLVLEALSKQTFTNFELIFVDYGSDTEVQQQAAQLVSSYGFAKYLYSDTRGWVWNRSHALNTGIKNASGSVVIISDIDLIFPPHFLENVNKLSFNNRFYTFSCYYLPAGINYSNITAKDLDNSEVNYVGLCAVSKEDISRINCFDEYYINWGGEDDDLYVRLENSGCTKQHMSVKTFPVLHQWHQKQAPSFPTAWYLEMVNYLYSRRTNDKDACGDYGKLIETSKRSILSRINEFDCFKKLELFPNPLFQFNLFLDEFFKMTSGSFGQFDFPVQPPSPPKGRKQIVIEWFNNQLVKWKLPYFLEKKNTNIPIHTRETSYDFIMYFIGKNRTFLYDYYLVNTDNKLALLFQKK